jgi:hypothetical protein
MKKLYVFTLALLGVACNEALDPKLDNTYSSEDAWSLGAKAQGILYNAYAAMGDRVNGYGGNFLDCATDNAATNDYASEVYSLATGGVSAAGNVFDLWTTAYAQLRNIHLFLDNGLKDNVHYSVSNPDVDRRHKIKYRGEAFFLRAWWQWQLLKTYGGVTASGRAAGYPIVISSSEGWENLPRNTYEECVAQIAVDLDSAQLYLPGAYSGDDAVLGTGNKGKATKSAAAALRAIVYLWAASDAYQDDGTTAGEREFKWIRAAWSADQAIRTVNLGVPTPLTTASYGASTSTMSDEFLIALNSGSGNVIERLNYAPSLYGQGRTNPSQNLVDAFPMANGYPTDHALSYYNPDDPYTGRDPRLARVAITNDAMYRTHRFGIYDGGADSYATDTRATRTGYYLRKWLADLVDLQPASPVMAQHFAPHIRKTEVWLAFAEAANMAWGPMTSDPAYTQGRTAIEAIKTLRNLSGIVAPDNYPDEVAAAGREAFDALILNERRLELAFENHRWFDLRRRMMTAAMAEPVCGIRIERTPLGYIYTRTEVERRPFTAKSIYNPIPQAEAAKNPLLEQNRGW